MDDLGGHTEELITSRQEHPAEPAHQKPGIPNRERINRRYGRILMICGISLLVGTTLTVALIPERITDDAPSLVTSTVVGDCLLLGTAGILASLLEMLSRYNRHLARQQLARETSTAEKVDLVLGLVAALPGRTAALEDGLQLLVDSLPDDAQRRYWAGFNDAVREGFRATGTDGDRKPSRPPYIGLVPREPPEGTPS